MSAPVDLGQKHIAPLVPSFQEKYREIELELIVTDVFTDFSNDEDVAIRIGKLQDSDLIVRRIVPNRRLLCASPSYVDRHGEPQTPGDLTEHNCLSYPFRPGPIVWRFRRGDDTEKVMVGGNFRSNNGHVLCAAAIGGLGVILQPVWMVSAAVEQETLRVMLSEYEASSSALSTAIHAVYPRRKYLPMKVRVFIDFLAQEFRYQSYWNTATARVD